jgi:putative membrane protein
MMMGYGFEGPLGWLGIGIGMIVHLAFVVVIILAAVWMFKAVFPGKSSNGSPGSVEILKQRYAKGEINSEEYRRMQHELE